MDFRKRKFDDKVDDEELKLTLSQPSSKQKSADEEYLAGSLSLPAWTGAGIRGGDPSTEKALIQFSPLSPPVVGLSLAPSLPNSDYIIPPTVDPFRLLFPLEVLRPNPVALLPSRNPRRGANPHQGRYRGKEETIYPPSPWATNRRAVVRSRNNLLALGIGSISGEVECKKCKFKNTMEYDLEEKFAEVAEFIAGNKNQMYNRAPPEWMKPTFPACPGCPDAGYLQPVIAEKKRNINWLFLLLGQMLGICTLEQLRYFCKHNRTHRTGSKDRLLYSTYLGICKQLEPKDLFENGY